MVLIKRMYNNYCMSSFEDYYYSNIARRVRFYRIKSGLTQEALSDILGKNSKYIGHIERCERYISNKAVIKLMEFWNIQPAEFFNFDENFNFDDKS